MFLLQEYGLHNQSTYSMRLFKHKKIYFDQLYLSMIAKCPIASDSIILVLSLKLSWDTIVVSALCSPILRSGIQDSIYHMKKLIWC
jgi:hypothetical protein